MSDTKISAMTAATVATASTVPVVQGGVNKKVTMTGAGAAMIEAANAAAQQVLLGIIGGGAIGLGGFTLTVPATGTAALLGVAQTFTAANIFSANGAASTPALSLTGSVFTGGSGTTTKPLFLIETAGASAVTSWNTNGTFFGANAASGSTADFVRFAVNGTGAFTVGYNGGVVCGSISPLADASSSIGANFPGKRFAEGHFSGQVNALYYRLGPSGVYVFQVALGAKLGFRFTDSTGTDSAPLMIGPATASFPALSNSGSTLLVRLGDDSGYAPIDASAYKVGGVAGVSGTITAASTVTVVNGIITVIA